MGARRTSWKTAQPDAARGARGRRARTHARTHARRGDGRARAGRWEVAEGGLRLSLCDAGGRDLYQFSRSPLCSEHRNLIQFEKDVTVWMVPGPGVEPETSG